MTIKPHLFYSSVIHFALIAYVLSIPIYKGSLYSTNTGPYQVALIGAEKPAAARVAVKAPKPKEAGPSVIQKPAAAEPEAPVKTAPSAAETPEAKEPVSQPVPRNDAEPAGITLIPEDPHKPTIVARADPNPIFEHKPQPEKKPEPPRPGPVVLPHPPERNTEPVVAPVKELTLPEDPAPVSLAGIKPAITEQSVETAKAELPAEAGRQATEVRISEREIRDSDADTAPDDDSKTITVAEKKPETAPIASGIAVKVPEKVNAKEASKTEKKPGVPAKGNSAAQKSRPVSSSLGDAGNGVSGPSGDAKAADAGSMLTAGPAATDTEKPKDQIQHKPPLGIAVSDALFHRDIKIEISVQAIDNSGIKSSLYRRTHPSIEEFRPEQKTVPLVRESDEERKTLIFSVAKAEKGVYTFVMQNAGEIAGNASVMIRLLEGKKGARNRKFGSLSLAPENTFQVKFILPEGIFWDDESYFTGSIESSDSITKFNDITGIVWKEDKD